MEKKKITFDTFIRGIICITLFVGTIMLFNRLSSVLLPFFIAWLLAYLIHPMVKFIQFNMRVKNRVLSIATALLIILGAISAFILLVIPPILEEFGRVNQLLITYLTNGINNSSDIPQSLTRFISEHFDFHTIDKLFNEENIINTIKKTLPKVWNILSESLHIVFSIFASFIILLYLIFILLDYDAINRGWIKLMPKRYRRFSLNLVNDMEKGMNTYFRGQALVALSVGILFSIGFIIIDFPLAIGLGLFIGALNLVPYLQIIGILPTILLAILKSADTGQNFWIITVSALSVFVIVQIIQDTLIVPKIMGKITGLNPAIILLSLSIWGSLMGILGMIIALPLTTLLLSYYRRFVIHKEKITEDDF